MIGRFYNKTIVIKRITSRQVATGFQETEAEIGTVRCRIRPLSESEIYANNKNGIDSNYRAYCNVTDIQTGDIVYQGEVSYEVKQVKNPMDMGHHLEVDLLHKT